jgi:hypothetical protein
MDMGGNVYQFTEGTYPGIPTDVALRGGSWAGSADGSLYFAFGGTTAQGENDSYGFRVAAVPVPSTFALAALSTLGLFAARLRTQRRIA